MPKLGDDGAPASSVSGSGLLNVELDSEPHATKMHTPRLDVTSTRRARETSSPMVGAAW
jgi:hypothetical protein